MSATGSQIAKVRRMVNEATADTYSDDDIASYIEQYPCLDERGEEPYTWDTSTFPPTQDANESWLPTYDLHAAAADIWEEKASIAAQDYDFDADGGSYKRVQVYEAYMKQARYHRSRRKVGTVRSYASPAPDSATMASSSWVINTAEPAT